MSKISITTLGDLVEFQRGYDLPKSEFKEGNVPVISSNGILGFHNVAKVKAPGITIGRSGTVGLPHFIDEDFFPHNTSLFIKDFKGNIPKYIFYLIKTLKLNEYGSGSGVPTMNRNHLHPIKVSAHLDVITQKKIAKVLSDLDTKIEINNTINAELEAMAKTMYDYWFVQFDFPDKNGKPYKSSGGKMVWSDELKREIPEGWGVKSLGELISPLESGKRPKGGIDKSLKSGIPSLGAESIDKLGYFDYKSTKYIPFSYKEKITSGIIRNNDILIYKDGAYVGKTTLFRDDFPFEFATINEHVFLLRAAECCFQEYLLFTLKQESYFNLMQTLGQKAAQPGLNQSDLKSLIVILPDEVVIKKFKEGIEPLFARLFNNSKENQELASLRDWLLPMLMNGQVTVGNITINDIEKDEVLAMVAEPVKEIVSKRKKETKVVSIKANPIEIYKRTLLAAEIVYQLHKEATLGHLKLQKLLYLCQEVNNMSLPMNFLKQAMGPYDNRLMRSLDKQFEEKRWFKFEKTEFLKYKPLGAVGAHQNDYLKYFEGDKPKIDYLIATFRKYRSHDIEAVATLYACWKEAIDNKELVSLELILKKFYAWSEEKEKFKPEELKSHLTWMRNNGICPK